MQIEITFQRFKEKREKDICCGNISVILNWVIAEIVAWNGMKIAHTIISSTFYGLLQCLLHVYYTSQSHKWLSAKCSFERNTHSSYIFVPKSHIFRLLLSQSKAALSCFLKEDNYQIWFIGFCQKAVIQQHLVCPWQLPGCRTGATCKPHPSKQKPVRNMWKCNKMAHKRAQTAHSRSGQESTKAERGWKWWRGGKRRR